MHIDDSSDNIALCILVLWSGMEGRVTDVGSQQFQWIDGSANALRTDLATWYRSLQQVSHWRIQW